MVPDGRNAMQAIQRLCMKNSRICISFLSTKARGEYKNNSKDEKHLDVGRESSLQGCFETQ